MTDTSNALKLESNGNSVLPTLAAAEDLADDLRRIMVRSEAILLKGETREYITRLESWIESYRRGLSAAQKISNNATDMLQKTRDQLQLSLEELLRLEDEGGNPASKEQALKVEELRNAIRRIDHLKPLLQESFQWPCLSMESANS